MKLSFLGGARMVTGSSFLLQTKNSKILIDCGLFQGGEQSSKLNLNPFLYDPKEIEAVLITHAHIDHIGRLPLLVKRGFIGKIFSTIPTRDLAQIILVDSEEVGREAAQQLGAEPLYDVRDVEKTIALFQGVKYKEKINLNQDISFCFQDAGHVLGSAIIELWADGKKIVFSGDLGNPPIPLLRPPEFIEQADYILVESTYGSFVHDDKSIRRDILEDIIEETVDQNGVLLIPAFALERTQELLYELNNLVENHKVPQVPIFIDSPMAIDLLEVYKKHQDCFNQEAAYLIQTGDDLFKFSGLKMTYTAEQSKQINNIQPPKIILAGSGMSTGGRILHHELRYLSDPKNTFLIVCYQVKGTLGRKIFDGVKRVRIFNKSVPVRIKIKAISGYSSHADQPFLYNWVKKAKQDLKKVFVVHGEETQAQALAQRIQDHLGILAEVPKLGQEVNL